MNYEHVIQLNINTNEMRPKNLAYDFRFIAYAWLDIDVIYWFY